MSATDRPPFIIIPTSAERSRLYQDTQFSRFCECNGIPTGVLVPFDAYELASKSFAGRYYGPTEQSAALLMQAQALLASGERREAA